MSFSKIVWRMAKRDYRKYTIYFACLSCVVFIFFTFSTIYFNHNIVAMKKSYSFHTMLNIPAIALLLFTIVFIYYAHFLFMKQRKAEFGLFQSIGASPLDICKWLLIENIIVGCIALLFGLLSSAVFSKLLFVAVIWLLKLEQVYFHISTTMFSSTILLFSFIFIVAVLISLAKLLKSSILQQTQSMEFVQSVKVQHPFFSFLGILIVISSIIGLVATSSNPHFAETFVLFWFLLTIAGLFLSIHQLIGFVLTSAKKFPTYYYRKLLFLATLQDKFKQLVPNIVLVTLMIMISMLYSTINLSTQQLQQKRLLELHPFDIVVTTMDEQLPSDKLQAIFSSTHQIIKKQQIIPTLRYQNNIEYTDVSWQIISVDHINSLLAKPITVDEKEWVYILNQQLDGEIDTLILPAIPFESGFQESMRIAEPFINFGAQTAEWFVVHEEDFLELQTHQFFQSAFVHIFNVEDWTATSETIALLEQQLDDRKVEEISSKIQTAMWLKSESGNGLTIFISFFVSLLFFIGAVFLLYLHIVTELKMDFEYFHKIQLIGMTDKEIQAVLMKQLLFLFFSPTIVGGTIAFLYFVALSTDIGGIWQHPKLLGVFVSLSIFYFLVQFIFFYRAWRLIVKKICKT